MLHLPRHMYLDTYLTTHTSDLTYVLSTLYFCLASTMKYINLIIATMSILVVSHILEKPNTTSRDIWFHLNFEDFPVAVVQPKYVLHNNSYSVFS